MNFLPLIAFAALGFSQGQQKEEPSYDLNFAPRLGSSLCYQLRMRVTVGQSSNLLSSKLTETICKIEGDGSYTLQPKLTETAVESKPDSTKPAVKKKENDKTGLLARFSRAGVMLGHEKDVSDPNDYALQRYFYFTSPLIMIPVGVEWRTDWTCRNYPKVAQASATYVFTGLTDWNGKKCAVVKISTTEGKGTSTVTGVGKCFIDTATGYVCLYQITLSNVEVPAAKARGVITYYKELEK